MIAIIRYHYAIDWSKLNKTCCCTKNIEMENNEFKKVCTKNCMCYYFNDIIKFEDFDFDNISVDEKSYKNILVYDISYKTLIGQNHCILDSIK